MLESGFRVEFGKRLFADHMAALFPNVLKKRNKTKQTTDTVYYGIKLKTIDPFVEINTMSFENLPTLLLDDFIVKQKSEYSITCECDSECVINGSTIMKQITLFRDCTWKLEIAGKNVDLTAHYISNTYQLNEESIKTLCKIVKLVSLCHAAPLTKAVVVSRYHTVENFKFQNGQQHRTIRSVVCEKIVPMHASVKVCRKCQKMKLTIPTQISNTCNKENENATVSSDYKMNNNIKQQNSTTKDNIMKMFPGACEDMVEILLNQANNCTRDPRGRRWSQGVISACLKWFMRSPQSYQDFRDSKLLLLPSPTLLILYKNRVKNNVGFDDEVFKWMHLEAKRRELPVEGWSGGIILDEMAIQSDLQINKCGDLVELSGLVEMGAEGNTCHTLRTGKTDRPLGTHALQMVFLGITGFRFPFAHFITDGIQAPELYPLFWEAVDKLQTFGFEVMYTCMDGAQCNRSFMKYNIFDSSFICSSPCNLDTMIFMMDISHVLKKIRNNVLKSGVLNTCTRLLTLPSKKTVQWQMFVDCFHWDRSNALQLHRRLTNEHFFPSTQSKMRNHLAEEVLNSDMLHVMHQYQLYLGPRGVDLEGAIEFLQKTSVLIEVFKSYKPVRSLGDERLVQLQDINKWFQFWELSVEKKAANKALLSYQCHEDIHACIIGFLNLCHKMLNKKSVVYVTPALINSDVIENTFNQMRSTYNGASSNPNALQYRRTLNSIILGQKTISQKANAGKSRDGAMLYHSAIKKPLKRLKSSAAGDRQAIKVIRC